MWEKLLDLFKEQPVTDEVQSSVPVVTEQNSLPVSSKEGKSTHIGYNYLKGLDGESEDSSKHLRRFINLNKLLRGRYNGKIEATDAEPESNIRREDTE